MPTVYFILRDGDKPPEITAENEEKHLIHSLVAGTGRPEKLSNRRKRKSHQKWRFENRSVMHQQSAKLKRKSVNRLSANWLAKIATENGFRDENKYLGVKISVYGWRV